MLENMACHPVTPVTPLRVRIEDRDGGREEALRDGHVVRGSARTHSQETRGDRGDRGDSNDSISRKSLKVRRTPDGFPEGAAA